MNKEHNILTSHGAVGINPFTDAVTKSPSLDPQITELSRLILPNDDPEDCPALHGFRLKQYSAIVGFFVQVGAYVLYSPYESYSIR